MSDLYWLADEQTARLEPYFPRATASQGLTTVGRIIFVNRNGLC